MFLLNMSFISRVKWTIFIIEIKDIFNKKHLNFHFIIYKFPIIFKVKRSESYLTLAFVLIY